MHRHSNVCRYDTRLGILSGYQAISSSKIKACSTHALKAALRLASSCELHFRQRPWQLKHLQQ
jgi:hypothetical protein